MVSRDDLNRLKKLREECEEADREWLVLKCDARAEKDSRDPIALRVAERRCKANDSWDQATWELVPHMITSLEELGLK
jgi:hypothetical protein